MDWRLKETMSSTLRDCACEAPVSDITHRRLEPCPYLGQYWDRSIRASSPDHDNRCFTRFRRVPFLLLFTRKRLGGQIDIMQQESVCYRDHRRCLDYQKATSPPASETVSAPQITSL